MSGTADHSQGIGGLHLVGGGGGGGIGAFTVKLTVPLWLVPHPLAFIVSV